MRVKVLFFGQIKDIVGKPEEERELDPGTRLEDLFDRYAVQFPKLASMRQAVVLARNQEFAGRGTLLADGDEVAFLPPVSGG